MSLEFEIPLFSLIFIGILAFVYFSKPKLGLKENKCFEVILIASLFEILIDTVIHFICALNSFDKVISLYYPYINFLNKILVILFVIIFSSLLCYTLIISYEKLRKNAKVIVIPLVGVLVFAAIVLMFTNVELIQVGYVTNVKGSTTMFGYCMVAVMLIASLITALSNNKKIDKRYFPIFFIIVFLGILYIATLVFPGIIIYDLVLALLCYVMYFTIENPDLQMLREFHKAREYADNLNTEKSEFLFNMASEIKTPISIINRISKDVLMQDDINLIKENVNEIKYSSNNLLELVDKVLDINSIEKRKVSVRESKYNTNNLFKGIMSQTELKLKNSIVNFRTNYDKSIPNELYGDSVRLRQIINTILDNSIKYTKEGFIELGVNSIIKHDICRLIITIEDSGIGMKSEVVEHLFDKDLNKINEIDNLDMDLSLVKTLLDLIGGTIIVNSEINRGTKFTIVLDQKVGSTKNKTLEDVLKYEEMYLNNKKIMCVINDEALSKKINNLLKKYPFEIETVKLGQSCLEEVRNGEKFDLIIMEEKLEKLSSVNTLEKLKTIQNFKTPVILLTNIKDINEKEEYLKLGFTEVLTLPLKKENINELVKTYELVD